MTTIQFSGVRKAFGQTTVLDDLTFAVDRGEVYGLLGSNGSGKSTAINILCNLLDPDRGTVEIMGRPAARAARHAVGLCPQDVALYRDLHPAENLMFFAKLYGLPRADRNRRVAEIMQLFELDRYAHVPVAALSGGWRQRVNIAVGLVHRPEVLVLDEPTSAVDLEARHALWRIITTLRTQGMTILLTTHHLDEAERLCSRVGILQNGRIAAQGTVAQLLALVPAKAIALVECSDEARLQARVAELGWGMRHYADRTGLLLPAPISLSEVVQALPGIDITSIVLQRVALEHAYLEVLHGPATMTAQPAT